MAVGLPVVTTSRALLSLGATPGREILVGDTPEQFSASVLGLLDNPDRGREIGGFGHLYVRRNHDWKMISEQLVGIYGSVTLPVKADFA